MSFVPTRLKSQLSWAWFGVIMIPNSADSHFLDETITRGEWLYTIGRAGYG